MNWEKLFSMQQQLDHYIQTNHDVAAAEVFDKKILALLVELGELANETRCFKFWSHKPASERSVILEEYVDGLHFILSIGIDQGFQTDSIAVSTIKGADETELFNRVFSAVIRVKELCTLENYLVLFGVFLSLGSKLGFSETDIQAAYYLKNEVNFARQDSDY